MTDKYFNVDVSYCSRMLGRQMFCCGFVIYTSQISQMSKIICSQQIYTVIEIIVHVKQVTRFLFSFHVLGTPYMDTL